MNISKISPARYLLANNTRLAYYERGMPDAATIYFVHGNSGSANAWRKQYSSDMLASYRLIAFDLPAHGNSDASSDFGYDLAELGLTVAEAVKMLHNDSAFILIGVSLGANIVVEACQWLTPAGIVLAGPTIVGDGVGPDRIAQPDVDLSPIFSEDVPYEAVRRYGTLVSASTKEEDIEHFLKDYQNVKPGFRSKLYEGIIEGRQSDEIELVKSLKNVLAIFGNDERIVQIDYLDELAQFCYQHRIFKIPEAGHFVQIDQPEVFNQLVAEYMKEFIS